MKIATWNINSVRLRIDNVLNFLNHHNIDVLCLQETKCEDDKFPAEKFANEGYKFLHFTGEKSYNGVAIISKFKFKPKNSLSLYNNDKRHISAEFEGFGSNNNLNFELHNIYIPAGGDIPDVQENPKFKHKIEYNKELTKWFSKNREKGNNIIAVGDFNIAPFENDVWSHKQLLDVVSHTPIEVEHLEKFRKSINFVDVARDFVPHSEKLYSWWSYRNQDWKKSNRGRRLDHIWVTEPLKNQIRKFEIYKETRDWQSPSDHTPVIIEI
ncbi:MAG: exodeoxyribonuclease III [Rickettsiales bacterium]|nr:exodeoxyribonuclease III [Rickettsiales bacterium]